MRATGVLFACWILTIPAALLGTEVRWLDFEPSVVELSGILAIEVHLGPPTYGEQPKRDRKLRVPVLKLSQPVNIRGNPASELNVETRENVKEVQLSFPERDDYRRAQRCEGRWVTVRGTLSSRHTGRHFKEVLLEANKVEWCKPARNNLPAGRH